MNELLLFITALVSTVLVLAGWKFGKERLYSVIIVFLILISAVGGKIAVFFGHETNTGNIFYAAVFLATYFLIERFGRKEGIYSIWVGMVAVLFFSILVRITVGLIGSETTSALNEALSIAFNPLPQVALASLCAYGISQSLNVYLYLRLKDWMHGSKLWLRANISNALAQSVDSIIFFTIAFWGVALPSGIFDLVLTGIFIKVVYMMVASPLLYLNTIEEGQDREGNTVIMLR